MRSIHNAALTLNMVYNRNRIYEHLFYLKHLSQANVLLTPESIQKYIKLFTYPCVNDSSNVELLDERITSKESMMAILTWFGADCHKS